MKDCIPCLSGLTHIWHDNGKPNPEGNWEDYQGIDWHRIEDGRST